MSEFPNIRWIDSLDNLTYGSALLVDSEVWLQYPALQTGLPISANKKDLTTLRRVVDHLCLLQLTERDTITVVGGGAAQDVCGLAASIYHRGLIWDFVPTTLVAQVDSCVSGKVAINTAYRKNVLGAHSTPRDVYQYWGFIDSLPEAEVRSGWGEIIKTHFVGGMFDALPDTLTQEVVRDTLNIVQGIQTYGADVDRVGFVFGHTFGEPLEELYPHGVAVLHGMHIATRVARALGIVDIYGIFEEYLLERPHLTLDAYLTALRRHKRCQDGRCQVVLPVADRAVVAPFDLSLSAIKQLLRGWRYFHG